MGRSTVSRAQQKCQWICGRDVFWSRCHCQLCYQSKKPFSNVYSVVCGDPNLFLEYDARLILFTGNFGYVMVVLVGASMALKMVMSRWGRLLPLWYMYEFFSATCPKLHKELLLFNKLAWDAYLVQSLKWGNDEHKAQQLTTLREMLPFDKGILWL